MSLRRGSNPHFGHYKWPLISITPGTKALPLSYPGLLYSRFQSVMACWAVDSVEPS